MPTHLHFSPQPETQNMCPHGPATPEPDSSLPLTLALTPVTRRSLHPLPIGVDTMASYEEVLRLLRYRNWHTRSLLDRKFKLVCSELNGRYVSNEFQVEVGAGPPLGRASGG